MIVIDANVWVRALVDSGPIGDACRTILSEARDWAASAHTPVEALRTLRRCEFAGQIAGAEADLHANSILQAPVEYTIPDAWLLARG